MIYSMKLEVFWQQFRKIPSLHCPKFRFNIRGKKSNSNCTSKTNLKAKVISGQTQNGKDTASGSGALFSSGVILTQNVVFYCSNSPCPKLSDVSILKEHEKIVSCNRQKVPTHALTDKKPKLYCKRTSDLFILSLLRDMTSEDN